MGVTSSGECGGGMVGRDIARRPRMKVVLEVVDSGIPDTMSRRYSRCDNVLSKEVNGY